MVGLSSIDHLVKKHLLPLMLVAGNVLCQRATASQGADVPCVLLLADRPNSIQHWQLRDLVSCVEDDAGKLQLFTVCGRRTYRFDVQAEKVCARSLWPANLHSSTSNSAASLW